MSRLLPAGYFIPVRCKNCGRPLDALTPEYLEKLNVEKLSQKDVLTSLGLFSTHCRMEMKPIKIDPQRTHITQQWEFPTSTKPLGEELIIYKEIESVKLPNKIGTPVFGSFTNTPLSYEKILIGKDKYTLLISPRIYSTTTNLEVQYTDDILLSLGITPKTIIESVSPLPTVIKEPIPKVERPTIIPKVERPTITPTITPKVKKPTTAITKQPITRKSRPTLVEIK